MSEKEFSEAPKINKASKDNSDGKISRRRILALTLTAFGLAGAISEISRRSSGPVVPESLPSSPKNNEGTQENSKVSAESLNRELVEARESLNLLKAELKKSTEEMAQIVDDNDETLNNLGKKFERLLQIVRSVGQYQSNATGKYEKIKNEIPTKLKDLENNRTISNDEREKIKNWGEEYVKTMPAFDKEMVEINGLTKKFIQDSEKVLDTLEQKLERYKKNEKNRNIA